MTDFQSLRGFEDALRPPADVRSARLTPSVLKVASPASRAEVVARFVRVARGAPEVMVKITGRTRDAGHLRAHLDYISRNGVVALEGTDGERLQEKTAIREFARGWSEEAAMEPNRRRDSPLSVSIVLSMPAGTEAWRLHDAARAFASEMFAERFPFVFALHDEGRHPHVHLTVRALGRDGERLNPRKADLQLWRERFAHALRERSVEAEATPRRARGVTRKSERTSVRRMRERFLGRRGDLPHVLADAYQDALRDPVKPKPWLATLRAREAAIRRSLVAEAMTLQRSSKSEERALGMLVERFVRSRPDPQTRDEVLRRAEMARSQADRTDRPR